MGKLLFIRVSAETYDEAEVAKTWPLVYRLAYEDVQDPFLVGIGQNSPVLSRKRGVLELIARFQDVFHFGQLPVPLKNVLEKSMDNLACLVASLEESLANRDAQKAYALTNAIEEMLSAVELAVREAS